MKKLFFIPGIIFSLMFLLASCDKGDMKIKKLYHGDGIWDVTERTEEYYDLAGRSVDSVSSQTSPAEIVFFRTQTLDGLFDYHFACINLISSSGSKTAYPCGVFFDNVRANVEANSTGPAVPNGYAGTWTVEESSRHKQTWTQYTLRADGSLFEKVTLKLKFR